MCCVVFLRIILSNKCGADFLLWIRNGRSKHFKGPCVDDVLSWDNNLDEGNVEARCDLVIAVFFDCTVGIVRVAWEDAKSETGGAN